MKRTIKKKAVKIANCDPSLKRIVMIADKHTAIDFTPIYYLQATCNINAGSILRFDTAEDVVRLETKGNNA